MPDGNADPNERAGFILMPEIGASNVMYVATSKLAHAPVYRDMRGRFETCSTTIIIPLAITNSARKARNGPRGPGVVATYRTAE
jgi:hypothetical protein